MTKLIYAILPEKEARVEVNPEKTFNNEPYIESATGIKVHFLAPKEEEIEIMDIAHSLSNQCRFTGHTSEFYSIAEHSLLVASLINGDNKAKLCALLHDAMEAYLTDVATPIKKYLVGYKEIENNLWKIIAKKFDLPEELPIEVKIRDRQALLIEAEQLIPSGGKEWLNHAGTYENIPDIKLACLSPKDVRLLFLVAFNNYGGQPRFDLESFVLSEHQHLVGGYIGTNNEEDPLSEQARRKGCTRLDIKKNLVHIRETENTIQKEDGCVHTGLSASKRNNSGDEGKVCGCGSVKTSCC